MKNHWFVITVFALFVLLSIKVSAQPSDQCWYNKDYEKDHLMGVSSYRAYEELLKDKKPVPVIVAIIDGGTDIEHEDLRDVIWTNEDEIADNGIDDDGNGYIDDIHGWSFIGNPNGESVQYDNLEVTRVYRMLKPTWENVDSERYANDPEFKLYIEVRDIVEQELASATATLERLNTLESNLRFSDSVLTIYFKTPQYTVSQVKSIRDENLKPISEFMVYWMSKDISADDIASMKPYFEEKVNYRYNIDYDPRSIVGDDWTDNSNPYYGSNDVEGPSPGHGTAVAGNVAAVRLNGIGPDGVTSEARLMILRVVPDGDERDKDVANAIIYAVKNGASIINMSFGKGYSPQKHMVDSALRFAAQHDVLLIHAAGNEAENNDIVHHYPLNLDDQNNIIAPNWITVGASTSSRGKNLAAPFSNYGSKTVDVFAPGTTIYSCDPDNKYSYADGTSMASPVTSGVAAIIRAYFPELTASEVREIIMQSVTRYEGKVIVPGSAEEGKKPIKKPFTELSVSGGVVNVYKALLLAAEKMKTR